MAKELVFANHFRENYRKLPPSIQQRFDKQLKLFLENPRHPSLKIHRYKTELNVWEAYVTMQYRFTSSITKVADSPARSTNSERATPSTRRTGTEQRNLTVVLSAPWEEKM